MGRTIFLGKLLIIASLLFQAYHLLADRKAITDFDKQLIQSLQTCNCFSQEIKKYIHEYLRLVVGAFLASSVLILLSRCWCFKLSTLLGLIALLWVEHHKVFAKIPTISILENTGFWHSIGVIGVVVYLLSIECVKCDEKNQTDAKKDTKAEDKKKK